MAATIANAVFIQLYQTEYLRASRRWGIVHTVPTLPGEDTAGDRCDRLSVKWAWYFKNDVEQLSTCTRFELNVQRRLERMTPAPGMKPPPAVIVTLQYYFYR